MAMRRTWGRAARNARGSERTTRGRRPLLAGVDGRFAAHGDATYLGSRCRKRRGIETDTPRAAPVSAGLARAPAQRVHVHVLGVGIARPREAGVLARLGAGRRPRGGG